ncbi:MAG TPA: hypothetical protein ENJ84_03875 [Gammaproteobacteria bacterium]|nr:hypothetical protein [Gammaproteobacteria bacterium]
MATATKVIEETLEQDHLLPHYLVTTRQRFKAEVNRLTSRGMATLLKDQKDVGNLTFLMSYLYIYHWLNHNVPDDYRGLVLKTFRSESKRFLMDLLEYSDDGRAFIQGYIQHWVESPNSTMIQRAQLLALLADSGGDQEKLTDRLWSLWEGLHLFTRSYAIAYRDLAREERARYNDMLAEEDQQRLQLVDQLPSPPAAKPRFAKLGLIPAMGCPQTCRHCMFIFRPAMKGKREPSALYDMVNEMTESVLFTGGDLTKQLDSFYQAIRSMKNIRTFAILLNGDFANSRDETRRVLESMAGAIRQRSPAWPKARVMLQISFDEFHQEIIVDKKGKLKERIPVKKIANIVEAAPRYPDEIQLCLLHKQHSLNFSMELFNKGVFARLANELGARNHQVQVVAAAPSARLKRNPLNPDQPAQILKDATFILARYPKVPIMLTSSTIDSYGRASMMDESETVTEKDLLQQVLRGEETGESFDTDLMFWFNGWATLFSAVHMSLGNVFDDGMDTILARLQKDPLSNALKHFDLRLLDYYREVRPDLDERIKKSSGPHQLFHTITEEGEVRLHMTKRLIACMTHADT